MQLQRHSKPLFLPCWIVLAITQCLALVQHSKSLCARKTRLPSFSSNILPRSSSSPCASTANDDFESLFQEQNAKYGVDLAKEFAQEQQYRIRMTDQLQKSQTEGRKSGKSENQSKEEQASSISYGSQPTDVTKSSSGFFNQANPYLISSVPTQDKKRMEKRQLRPRQTRGSSSSVQPNSLFNGDKGDNLLLVMAATMTAYTNSSEESNLRPLLVSLLALLIIACLLGVPSSVGAGTDDIARWIFGESSGAGDPFVMSSFLSIYESLAEKGVSIVIDHDIAMDLPELDSGMLAILLPQTYFEEGATDVQSTMPLFS